MHMTKVILLVEDSDEDYETSVRALRGITNMVSLYRCRHADEAIEYLYGRGRFALPTQAPRPVLILLDLNLPGTDGRDLLALLKGDTYSQAIPVVVVTTSRNPRDIEWCYAHGADGYQVKGMDYPKFSQALRLYVEHWL